MGLFSYPSRICSHFLLLERTPCLRKTTNPLSAKHTLLLAYTKRPVRRVFLLCRSSQLFQNCCRCAADKEIIVRRMYYTVNNNLPQSNKAAAVILGSLFSIGS